MPPHMGSIRVSRPLLVSARTSIYLGGNMRARLYVGGLAAVAILVGVAFAGGVLPPDSDDTPGSDEATILSPDSIDATFDEDTAVEVARDAYTLTERDGNGLMRATVSQQPSSVLRDGQWVPISTELTELAGGRIAAVDHPLEPVFASSSESEGLVTVESEGHALTLSLVGAEPAAVVAEDAPAYVADGTAVRYAGAADGSDVVFQIGQQALYQTIELESAPDSQVTYEWQIAAPGLDVVEGESGTIQFVDAAGVVIFDMPGPVMWDSLSGDGDMAESASTAVDYSLEQVEPGSWRMVLKPSLEWLSDPARVYPVSIDPDIYQGSGMVATYKENNFAYNYASVPRIGNTRETSTCCAWRTVLRYPMNGYYGKRVTGAALVANWTYGSTANFGASLWYATAFNFAGNGAKIADFAIARQGVAYGGVFDMVASILNNSDSYTYLMLVGDENNAVYSRKDLSTYVTFTYVDPAVVTGVTGASPTSPAAGPLTPVWADDVVVQATGANYTPGTIQLFRYHFASSDGGAAWDSPWMAAGPYRVPDTALTPGKNYWYWIDSMDTGTASPVKTMGNANWMFHTRVAPSVPSAITVGGEPLTVDLTAAVQRPVLGATVSAADSGQVWALFTVKQDGIVVLDSVPGSKATLTAGASAVSTVTLPYALTPGAQYTVEVTAFDGHLESGVATSDPYRFTGPPRTIREIPDSNDTSTGATS